MTNGKARTRRGVSARRRRYQRSENVSAVTEGLETGYDVCEAAMEAEVVETA